MGPGNDAARVFRLEAWSPPMLLMRDKAIALIDGEHYLPVIAAALDKVREDYDLLGAVFIGGTEKIADDADLSMLNCQIEKDDDPIKALTTALEKFSPELVIDLSDEPIVGYKERFELVSLVLLKGISYLGPDFRFDPPTFHDIAKKPSFAIIGTGKRIGKTAVSAFACRELKSAGLKPCVVAMGRGGPSEPEIILGDKIEIDSEYLLRVSRSGKHAASDYFEDALLSRIPTVGCRRCGGGMAGKPYISNVERGAELANDLDSNIVIFEGSGASLPPIRVDARVVVCGVNQPIEYIIGYLGRYRLLISDLVVLTNCEKDIASAEDLASITEKIRQVKPGLKVVQSVFRPKPTRDISNEKVFFTTTAPAWVSKRLTDFLEENYQCEVIGVSHHLSNRKKLKEDIEEKMGKFTLVLTELKAAAVDVSTEIAAELGIDVTYCDNIPITIGGDGDLVDALISIADISRERFRVN